MQNAKNQARSYVRDLPDDHNSPPFLLVCDVGRAIEVYADFSGQGRHYKPYPDIANYRVFLHELSRSDVRDRFKAIWNTPKSLDISERRAKATQEVAVQLAAISKKLEERYPTEEVAMFLMRCLFCMFAEDMGLLPSDSFQNLLSEYVEFPSGLAAALSELWTAMDTPGDTWAISIRSNVQHFNGSFFKDRRALMLDREDIGTLLRAAKAEWKDVEPAIFGSLLEQALDREERARLGAHYTPRPYVERLVSATVMDVLRADWAAVQGAAERAKLDGDSEGARQEIAVFLSNLSKIKILDPACGTGNFLYVAMELVKELEAEVQDALLAFGGNTAQGDLTDRTARGVDPRNFLGIEKNRRAVAISELVLWIGYLQVQFRKGDYTPRQPILLAYANVRHGDAVLEWGEGDAVASMPIFVREGDDVREVYENPRRTVWPDADFIVGNPPFIGGSQMRAELGSAYVDALRSTRPEMNDSADLVMYWWDQAAAALSTTGSRLRRFGFVSTNSITQVLSRRTVSRWLEAGRPISLVWAIADHPWRAGVKDAAVVRISMTVAERGRLDGALLRVSRESGLRSDQPIVDLECEYGRINSDLTIGADLTRAEPLLCNAGLCSPGVKLHGAGFILSEQEAEYLGRTRRRGLAECIKPYLNGRDLTARARNALVIDLFGLSEVEVRGRYPEIYQHLQTTVKHARAAQYARSPTADAAEYLARWWIFGKPREELRPALEGLTQFIATPETAKHRVFQMLDTKYLPDNMVIAIATDDLSVFGILSSRLHGIWALTQGGTLEDRPRYSKSRCFDPFPFPDFDSKAEVRSALAARAGELDQFRKDRLRENPELTITKIYNVLELIRQNVAMSDVEKGVCERASIHALKAIHDEIDSLALKAYGWPSNLLDAEILKRLLALNLERRQAEAEGTVQWLRPSYQLDRYRPKGGLRTGDLQEELALRITTAAAKPAFPRESVAQIAEVMAVLVATNRALTANEVASRYRQGARIRSAVERTMMALARLGHANRNAGDAYAIKRAA